MVTKQYERTCLFSLESQQIDMFISDAVHNLI